VLMSSISFGYSGGSGTAGDPYQIADANDLFPLAYDTGNYNKCFILTADINLTGPTFIRALIAPDTNSSTSGFQGTTFTGVFDGNGHAISNLTITGSGKDYVGLFGCVSNNGQVKNLGIVNANIQGRNCVGGLVGKNSFFGSLIDCYATGSVNGSSNIGGLVGINEATITSCYATSNVTSSGNYVGGLVGYNGSGSTITSCYATGSVSGSTSVGGLGGYNFGLIAACYATGSVSGTSDVGGLVGYSPGNVAGSFWDTNTSGRTTSYGGTGKTTAEMQTLSTFTSAEWDFSTTDGDPADWKMPQSGYPRLAWENVAPYCGDPEHPYPSMDFNHDCRVDLADFAMFTDHWMDCNAPECD
jgi:hypothetical protein